MATRIQLNIKQLKLLSKEYETQVPFDHFYDKYSGNLTESEVIQNINNKIILILRNVINNYLDLDIAFIQIHKLIIYATDDIDKLFPNSSSINHMDFVAYYKFLIHFLIFGCCLGMKYKKYIVLDEDDHHYQNNEILRYCINEFIPKITQKHIKFKQCNIYHSSIKESLLCNISGMNYNISSLIADYVEYKYDEFFQTFSIFFQLWSDEQNKISINRNFLRLWTLYGFDPKRLNSSFIPRLLFSKQFIEINDNYKMNDNLEYFGNKVLSKSLKASKSVGNSICSYVFSIPMYKFFLYGFVFYGLPIWCYIGYYTFQKLSK